MKINLQTYYPLIYKIINQFDSKYEAELFNECYIQLHQLSRRIDEVKSSFETFAYKRLKGVCNDFISNENKYVKSLDDFNELEDCSKADAIEDDSNFESDFIYEDYYQQKNKTLTSIEKFIQQKYYFDGLSVKNIIRVYLPYHQIKSEKTIYKILNK